MSRQDGLDMQSKAMLILQQEAELQEIVQLVGPDALPERERRCSNGAGMIREDFLQQSAYHEVDTFTSFKKDFLMMKVILRFTEVRKPGCRSGDAPFEGTFSQGQGQDWKNERSS